MPLQNRVTPEGDIIATADRGLMLGNRGGAFHLPNKTLGNRRWASRQWIACVLAFKGRRRAAMMMRGRYTELFFLDEATALAAGHRPCFECRRRDAQHFAALWADARGWRTPPRACEMDAVLHAERIGLHGRKNTFRAPLAALPPGTFVRIDRCGALFSYLVYCQHLLLWSPAGYTLALPLIDPLEVEVLTPRSIVSVLKEGYRPLLHPSAAALLC